MILGLPCGRILFYYLLMTSIGKNEIQENDRWAAAIECLRQGRNAQAFLLLSEPKPEKGPAEHFNLGLCYFRAGDFSAAVSCFEKAQQLLKAFSAPQGRSAAENSETYLKLAAEQIMAKSYLNPMNADFCTLFPKIAEQAVLLCMIGAYQQKGLIEQARRLSSALAGPQFEAYKKTLHDL